MRGCGEGECVCLWKRILFFFFSTYNIKRKREKDFFLSPFLAFKWQTSATIHQIHQKNEWGGFGLLCFIGGIVILRLPHLPLR